MSKKSGIFIMIIDFDNASLKRTTKCHRKYTHGKNIVAH